MTTVRTTDRALALLGLKPERVPSTDDLVTGSLARLRAMGAKSAPSPVIPREHR